jgi:hypothetical protein
MQRDTTGQVKFAFIDGRDTIAMELIEGPVCKEKVTIGK